MSAQPAKSLEYSKQTSTARHNTKEIIETPELLADLTRLSKPNLPRSFFFKQVTQSQTKGKGKAKPATEFNDKLAAEVEEDIAVM